MKKLMIVVLMVLAFWACKDNLTNPIGPTPIKTEDIVEFMYVRTLPIISPNNPGPGGMTIWHDAYGGFNPIGWSSIGFDQWMCSKILKYSQFPYFIYLIDMKVTIGYTPIARTIYARIKGQGNWMELTSIEPNSHGSYGGEWAPFVFSKGVLSVPSSSFSR